MVDEGKRKDTNIPAPMDTNTSMMGGIVEF